MEKQAKSGRNELTGLCIRARSLMREGRYEECHRAVRAAMERYPHAPHPHNLLGILMERGGDHISAMKHFRAAWALDPTYVPCRFNLDRYAGFAPKGGFAFDESDCPPAEAPKRRSQTP